MTPRSNLTFILSTCLFILAPAALASAASQFHLNLNTRASKCWVNCHSMVTSTIPIPSLGYNGADLIDQNCQLDDYVSLMGQCFAQECESAPDAAYATEFAQVICKKAGYEKEFVLPEAYMTAAKAYFESDGYLNGGGVRGVRVWGTGDLIFILATSFAVSFFF